MLSSCAPRRPLPLSDRAHCRETGDLTYFMVQPQARCRLCLPGGRVKGVCASLDLPPGKRSGTSARVGNYRIIEDDLSGVEVAALLRLHLDEMQQWSPPESVHAMPIARLRSGDVTFYSAWQDERLAACGALKQLTAAHGELKSMRAHQDFRGRGAGRAVLEHLLGEARARGYARVSLETGRPAHFAPARRLYEAGGFAECPPFADYVSDPFSICMTRPQ